MPEDLTANLGITRRTLLRRGAVVGGALVWTVPTVRSLSRPAFASEGSPEPTGHAISYIALVLECTDGTTYRAKFNTETGWEDDPGPTEPQKQDCYPDSYGKADMAVNGGDLGLEIAIDEADPSRATVTIPASFTYTGGGEGDAGTTSSGTGAAGAEAESPPSPSTSPTEDSTQSGASTGGTTEQAEGTASPSPSPSPTAQGGDMGAGATTDSAPVSPSPSASPSPTPLESNTATLELRDGAALAQAPAAGNSGHECVVSATAGTAFGGGVCVAGSTTGDTLEFQL